MLKIKNKFILFIFFAIFSVVGYGLFDSYYNTKIDRNSNIVLINGKAMLNGSSLLLNVREKLKIGDNVRTIGNNALTVLEWGDGSVTRLGGNTTIQIKELYVSDNLEKINISFELLNGKTWSTVLSFLGKGSYFNETFNDSVASVRGTIFDIDLDNNYLHVIDHKVNLLNKKTNKSFIINENTPFNINTFDFISLDVFFKSFKDKVWENMNKKIDKKLFKGLEEKVLSDFNNLIDINNINIDKALGNIEEKERLYNNIIKDYQRLNFVKTDNNILFKKKIELKEALIKLSDDENKSILLKNTFYDFKNVIETKNYGAINELLSILGNNSDLIKSLELNKTIEFYKLPDDIKYKFSDIKLNFLNKVGEIQNININDVLNNTDKFIKNSLNSIDINFINK